MRITHLTLSNETRQLAAMRAAQLRRTLSEYFTLLVKADADTAGLSDFLAPPAQSEGRSE